jgi:hypothetical protein
VVSQTTFSWFNVAKTPQAPVRRLQINSKFDYNKSMFKVVSADEHQGIQAVCV